MLFHTREPKKNNPWHSAMIILQNDIQSIYHCVFKGQALMSLDSSCIASVGACSAYMAAQIGT